MNIKKLLASEYEKRKKEIETKIPNLEIELEDLEKKKKLMSEIENKKSEKMAKVEHDINQSESTLSQLDEKISKQETYLGKIKEQSESVDQMLMKFDNVKNILTDMTKALDRRPELKSEKGTNLVIDLPLEERKKILSKLKFTKRITNTPVAFVKGKQGVEKAINQMSDMKGSEGAVVKDLSAPYSFGETKKSSIKFRRLVDVHVRTLKKVPKERGLFNYLVGIDLKDTEDINPAKVEEVAGKKVLVLGHTFNTTESVEENKIIDIMLEEVWRHETKKGIHYSIHKPRFRQVRPDLTSTSTIDDLEDIVTSVGAAVKEFITMARDIEEAKKTLKDWPQWVQKGLRTAAEKQIWLPFVIQHHYRGHKIKEEERKDQKYEYNLRSLHSDFRVFIPDKIETMKENSIIKYEDSKRMKGICFGVTVNTPPSVDKLDAWDNNISHMLCEGKLPIPQGWLYTETVAKINEPGSTYHLGKSHAPGLLVRAAYGEALPVEVTDHIIKFQFKCRTGSKNMQVFEEADKQRIMIENKYSHNLKELKGLFAFTINHIGDRWLIFLNKVTDRKKIVTKEMMNQIFIYTQQDYSRREIAEKVGLSKGTVYNYQKLLGIV